MKYELKSFKKVLDITKIANIHYFEFTKEFHTFDDVHPFRELVYVDSGAVNVHSDGYTGVLEKNQLIVHKGNERHALFCDLNNAPNVIIIGFECKCHELDAFSSEITTLTDEEQKILTDVIREGRNVFLPPYDIPNIADMKKRDDYPFGADQMIKNKLEAFFIELIRSRKSVSEKSGGKVADIKIIEINNYLTENFREKINLAELCFLYGINKTTLCYAFKEAFGESIINYVNILRIKEAKKLLREGKYNLTQISSMVGFSSIHYFSRIFKQFENKSPTEYIKTIKSRLMI